MIRLTLEPIKAEAFAPCGQMLPPGFVGGPRRDWIDELQNERASAEPRLSLAAVAPRPLPLTAVEMERHVK